MDHGAHGSRKRKAKPVRRRGSPNPIVGAIGGVHRKSRTGAVLLTYHMKVYIYEAMCITHQHDDGEEQYEA